MPKYTKRCIADDVTSLLFQSPTASASGSRLLRREQRLKAAFALVRSYKSRAADRHQFSVRHRSPVIEHRLFSISSWFRLFNSQSTSMAKRCNRARSKPSSETSCITACTYTTSYLFLWSSRCVHPCALRLDPCSKGGGILVSAQEALAGRSSCEGLLRSR